MTLGELMTAFRQRVDDEHDPPLWSDAEVKSLINEAYYEAAERGRLLTQRMRVPLRAGKATYTLDGAIEIRRVYDSTSGNLLTLTGIENLDRTLPGWDDATQGEPIYAIADRDTLTIHPTPDKAYTLQVDVIRMPSALLADSSDTPEIASPFHLRMLDWAFYLAYDKHDVDTENLGIADKYAARFAESFGPRLSASVQRDRANTRPHLTKSIW